jgi:hypothetical protein
MYYGVPVEERLPPPTSTDIAPMMTSHEPAKSTPSGPSAHELTEEAPIHVPQLVIQEPTPEESGLEEPHPEEPHPEEPHPEEPHPEELHPEESRPAPSEEDKRHEHYKPQPDFAPPPMEWDATR